jgi:hypothetical protein
METNEMMPMRRRFGLRFITRILFALLILVIALVWLFGQKLYVGMKTKGYQAVFLTNGQVYFGKVSANGNWVKLTDIYYLQANDNLQQAATADQSKNANPSGTTTANPQNQIQLVKLGSELHGPEDVMYIEKDKVLFWENMKDDSQVVQAINKSR